MENRIRLSIAKRKIGNILFGLLVAVLMAIFISPFLVMVLTSFKTNSDAFTIPVQLLPRKWVFENYPAALSAIPYFRYMGNTILITVVSVIGHLLVTPMIAYSLSKIKWKGANIISGLVMATMMIPITVTMIPMYKIYSAIGWTNTYIPLILPAFFGKAFNIVIVRQSLVQPGLVMVEKVCKVGQIIFTDSGNDVIVDVLHLGRRRVKTEDAPCLPHSHSSVRHGKFCWADRFIGIPEAFFGH